VTKLLRKYDSETGNDILGLPTYNSIYFVSGAVIGGHKVVRVSATNGKVYIADKDDTTNSDNIVGMTLHSAQEDELIEVVTFGQIRNQGWGLSQGVKYYLTTEGNIGTTCPTTGYRLPIGLAISNEVLMINIFESILRVS